jgi:aryl carrier-like protein
VSAEPVLSINRSTTTGPWSEPRFEDRGPYEAPRDEVERALAEVWSEVLRIEEIGVHDNFFELGGDSILSIQVVARSAERGLRITSRQLFQEQTIAGLARVVESGQAAGGDRVDGSGEVALTPVQRWHFAQLRHPGWFSQSTLVRVPAGLDAEPVRGALRALVAAHDQLRARFWRDEAGGWRQEVVPAAAAMEPALVVGGALDTVAGAVQAERDPGADPMLRAGLVRTGEASGDLLVLDVHHLVMDGVSWRVLLGDLERALTGGVPGGVGTSFREWSRLLAGRAAELGDRAEEWVGPEWDEAGRLPVDLAGGANRADSMAAVGWS